MMEQLRISGGIEEFTTNSGPYLNLLGEGRAPLNIDLESGTCCERLQVFFVSSVFEAVRAHRNPTYFFLAKKRRYQPTLIEGRFLEAGRVVSVSRLSLYGGEFSVGIRF